MLPTKVGNHRDWSARFLSLAQEKKRRLLGEPLGTAAHKLRKMLLFSLAGKLELLSCVRCGKAITEITEFSIEHKKPWQSADDPRGAFFDLGNIGFSHLSCNVKEPRPSTAYTDEELLQALRECNGVLSKRKFYGPDERTYRARFGSWNKAVIAAGLQPNQIHNRKQI